MKQAWLTAQYWALLSPSIKEPLELKPYSFRVCMRFARLVSLDFQRIQETAECGNLVPVPDEYDLTQHHPQHSACGGR
jgi:hypothetical protein